MTHDGIRSALRVTVLVAAFAATSTVMGQNTTPVFRDPLGQLTVADREVPAKLYGFQSKYFDLSGYLRFRGDVFHDFGLGHGDAPDGEGRVWPAASSAAADVTVQSANLRLRLRPELHYGDEVRVVAEIDFLDNVVMGSTPRGFPRVVQAPLASGSSSQEPPASGVNSWADGVRVKKAWGELVLPFGALVVGRMGNDWGLGMVASSGEGIDDDWDESVDRVGFVTSVFDHFVGVSWDFNATGPTSGSASNRGGQAFNLTTRDDVNTLSVAVLRMLPPEVVRSKLRAGKAVFNYGGWFTWRRQAEDVPGYYLLGADGLDLDWGDGDFVRRDLDLFGGDVWLRLNWRGLRVEAEAAYVHGRAGDVTATPGVSLGEVTFDQWGLVAQVEWQPWQRIRLTCRGETGVASGDSAWGFGAYAPLDGTGGAGRIEGPQIALPGDRSIDNFRFSPNCHVDHILWRRIVGTFTDGVYAKGRVRWHPIDEIRLDFAAVYSRTLFDESAPGLAKPLGVELSFDGTWFHRGGFEATVAYAVLLPLAGFRNVHTGADPTPAHLAEARLAFRF
ncbi:MAG: TIGR04551 family protein [Deltaproteobacteria bacterium]|nr:TIGR04551 family protein [Deltaproteobacteria bacterium]